MIVFILLGLIIFFIYWAYIFPLSTFKRMGIPYIPGYPIVGSFKDAATKKYHFSEVLNNYYHQMKDQKFFGIFMFGFPMLLVKDLELLKSVTIKDFDHFQNRSTFFLQDDISPALSENLFSLKGEKWRRMRITLTSTYTTSKMRTIFHLMVEGKDKMINNLRGKISKSGSEKPLDVEIQDVFQRMSNDIIASTAFGVQVDSYTNPKNDFFLMGKSCVFFSTLRLMVMNIFPKLSQMMKFSVIPLSTGDYFTDMVKGTIKERKQHNIVRPDMINMMINLQKEGEEKNENQVTDDDISAQAFIFFLAAFETISTTLSFAVFQLASHPEVQERLFKEIETTFEECNGNVTYDILLKLKYLDMVISETLRQWPPAFMSDRCTTKPFTVESNGKKIELPVGTNIGIPIMAIHRDEKYWPKPELFDPERFSDENKDNIVPNTYLPFGIGPRICIGQRFALMECKLALFEIVRTFELSVTELSSIPIKISKASNNLKPENGFHVGLKLRK